MADPVVGIVLAAGMSSRLGRPKQLELVDGRPLVEHTVERLLASNLDQVVVVTGAHGLAVEQALTGRSVDVIANPAYATGQASSLVAGIRRAVTLHADAVVIALADQPGIMSAAIDALVNARRDGARLGMSRYGEERGHPVMFGRELFLDLLTLTGDTGGREIIQRCRHDLVVVDGGRLTLPADLDHDDDLSTVIEDITSG